VLVCDRNRPVARIVPCLLDDQPEQEQQLIARGILTPPLKKPSSPVSWPEPPEMFRTRSNKYGGKSGKTPRAAFGLLGIRARGTSLRSTKHHAAKSLFTNATKRLPGGGCRSQRIRRETGLESSPYGEILHRPDYYRPAQHGFQQMAFGGDGLGCGAAGGVALGGDYQGFVLR
jgi:antitoxin (DNA-binding transcriptional repressor) of toxin-antitoxin stability system